MNLTDDKGSSHVNLMFLAENVLHPFAPLNVKIGDLYLTNKGFTLSRFAAFSTPRVRHF
jgi:hypothetical protein